MVVHFTVMLLVLLSALFFNENQKLFGHHPEKIRKQYIAFVCIIFMLQSGLRNVAVGADTYQYYLYFEETKLESFGKLLSNFFQVFTNSETKDSGYPLVQKLFQIFSSNYTVYLIFIAILFFSALGRFLYYNVTRLRDVVFAFILYQSLFYDFFSITGLRQTLATAILLFGFDFIVRRKLILFLIVVIIAATIHQSALLYLPFYFIANIRKTKILYASAIILFPVFMIYKRNIALVMASVSTSDVYMSYATSKSESNTSTFTVLILLIAAIGWVVIKKALKKFPESFRYYNAVALAVAFTPLTWVDPNLMRVVQYFSIFMLVFIPIIINSIKIQPNSFRTFIFTIMITSLFLLALKNGGDYKFFWQDMKLGTNY